MSYYFVIVGTQDNPLFEYEFGTSKQGGDGAAHFADQARSMNQFIVHSSLDILEEVQWSSGQMYAFRLPPPAHVLPARPHPSSALPELVSAPQLHPPRQPPRQTRKLIINHSEQVPETHRPLLQQLHLRLRNPHERKVPPPPPARRPLPFDPLLLRRREPALLRNRGGRPQLLCRGPRELDQGYHEPVLQGGDGGHESCFPAEGCGGGEEVLVGQGLLGSGSKECVMGLAVRVRSGCLRQLGTCG